VNIASLISSKRTPLSKQRNKHLQTMLIEAAKMAPNHVTLCGAEDGGALPRLRRFLEDQLLAACVRQSIAARIAHHDLGNVRVVPPGEYSLYRSKLSVDPTPTFSAQRA
jgi:hypothetical protein